MVLIYKTSISQWPNVNRWCSCWYYLVLLRGYVLVSHWCRVFGSRCKAATILSDINVHQSGEVKTQCETCVCLGKVLCSFPRGCGPWARDIEFKDMIRSSTTWCFHVYNQHALWVFNILIALRFKKDIWMTMCNQKKIKIPWKKIEGSWELGV